MRRDELPWAEHAQQTAQKIEAKSSEQLLEVHRCCRKQCVECVTGHVLQPVSLQAMFVLQVTYTRVDGSAAFHPAPEQPRRSTSSSFVHMDRDWPT